MSAVIFSTFCISQDDSLEISLTAHVQAATAKTMAAICESGDVSAEAAVFDDADANVLTEEAVNVANGAKEGPEEEATEIYIVGRSRSGRIRKIPRCETYCRMCA